MTLPGQVSSGVLRTDKSQDKDGVLRRHEHLNEGIILIEVDDILEGGSEIHRKRMEAFYDRWKCEKKKNLRECGTEGSMISGINVVQHQDYSFTWHMQRYAEEKLALIETPRGFLSRTKELDDDYMNKITSANGQIGWLGSNGRPDRAAHSIIAGGYKNRSPQLITWCN